MAGVYYFWFVRVSLLPRCFSQYILVIKYYLYINQCTLSLDILVFVMYFREVLRLSLAMLSYESIDTALNQLYILIYSFEFRISGIVKMNSNFQQLSVDE